VRATRLGRIFAPEQASSWFVSHAAYPTPLLLEDGRIRVYFNTRDRKNRGCLAWLDLDARDPLRVLDIAAEPGLRPGLLGTFDDRGISNGSIHRIGDELWLYYVGWNKSADVPFRNAIGLAVSSDREGRYFDRAFAGPLVDRSRFDPYTLSYPHVVPGRPGQPWHMLYGSSRAGGDQEDSMQHVITEAISDDGIDWRPTGRDVVALEPGEFGLSRPWLMQTKQGSRLLFSIRRRQYTIGAAALDPDGGGCHRLTDDLLGSSGEDWDSEATCYPAVFNVGATSYLLYCGNGYGRTGFGLALLGD
jgi:hypothetical protein